MSDSAASNGNGAAERDPETGEVYLNRAELARAFGVSEPTVVRWIAEGCPVAERGSRGVGYKSLASKVKVWLEDKAAREEAAAAERRAVIAQVQLDLVGGRPGEGPLSWSPKQRRELWEEEQAYQTAARATSQGTVVNSSRG